MPKKLLPWPNNQRIQCLYAIGYTQAVIVPQFRVPINHIYSDEDSNMTNGAPKPSSVNRVDLLQEKLQQLVESQLTNDIVIPLFKSFGYQDVTYSGGLT